MLKFALKDWVGNVDELDFYHGTFCAAKWEASEWNASMLATAIEEALHALISTEKMITGFEMPASKDRCTQLLDELRKTHHRPFAASTILTQLSGLMTAMRGELQNKLCLYVPANSAGFFEQEALFGEEVHAAFPDAVLDIKEAGNCIALARPTAAVFHLVRALEHALRALAKRLRVKFDRNKIEFATWENVIKKTDMKIAELQNACKNKGRNKARMATLEYYQGIMLEYSAMKDKIRNVICHSRVSYDELESLSFFNHSKEFMQKLAKKMR